MTRMGRNLIWLRRVGIVLFSFGLGVLAPLFSSSASASDRIPRRFHLGFDGLELDVRKGTEQIPPLWRIPNRPASPSGKQYRVVKWGSAVGLAERNALRATGVEILGSLPDDAYLVRGKGDAIGRAGRLSGLTFTGELPAAARVSGELRRRVTNLAGWTTVPIRVVLHESEPDAETLRFLRSVAGLALLPVGDAVPGRGERLRADIPAPLLADALRELASRPEIAWVEAFHPKHLDNTAGDWVHQSFVLGSTPIFDIAHIYGCGQVVAIADTGFDFNACWYWDPVNGAPPIATCAVVPCPSITADPNQRKTLAYYNWSGGPLGPSNGCNHGNHVQGSVAGNSLNGSLVDCSAHSYVNGTNVDGMAPGARVISQEMGDDLDYLNSLSGSLYNLASVAYENGARLHSNSWGGGCCSGGRCVSGCDVPYDSDARDADLFTWQKKDLLFLIAAGNDNGCCQAPLQVGSPGNAKNIVTAGATDHDNGATRMAGYSSRGATTDGRLKPTVDGQGSGVASASSDGDVTSGTHNCGTCALSGTSMATPTLAGTTALVREYLTRGFYPNGFEDPLHQLDRPSSALLKALLVSSGQHLTGTGTSALPNQTEGWGRVLLDDVLYLPGDAKKLWLNDDPVGLETGGDWSTTLSIGAGLPLKVTLVWTDYPALLGANPTLVNDLKLEVVDPSGAAWFQSLDLVAPFVPVQTSDSAKPGDARNTEEQLVFSAPAAGNYTIRVRGVDVPMGPQPFAVVVTGNLSSCTPPAVPTGLTAAASGLNRISLSWPAVPDAGKYRVFRAEGACPGVNRIALASTVSTSYLDTTSSGNVLYCYAIQSIDSTGGCASRDSGGAEVTGTGDCLIAPVFAGAREAKSSVSGACGVDLTWDPAFPSCPAFTARFNIYRSKTPDFTPGAENLIARCVDGSSRSDTSALESGLTYYYIVRAEDSGVFRGGPCNGGLEDGNLVRVRATPQNPNQTAPGTFIDHAGDTSAQLTGDSDWRITRALSAAGEFSYHNAPDGQTYAQGDCSSLATPPLQLTTGEPHVFSFKIDYDIEYQWDGLVLEISSDSGASWSQLAPDGGYPATLSQTQGNGCNFPVTEGAFSGPPNNSGLSGWKDVIVSLPASYDGKTVSVRFRFTSDSGLELEGAYLDEISMTGVNLPGACTTLAAPPVADFAAVDAPVCPGQPIRFQDLSSFAPSSWSWEFGDGSTSSEFAPSHSFASAGTYQVTLRVSNSAGSSTKVRAYAVRCDAEGYAPLLALPGVARAQGSGGSFFKSTIWVTYPAFAWDPAAQPNAKLRMTYAAQAGGDAGSGAAETFELRPGEIRAFEDPLGALFGVTGDSSGVVTIWTLDQIGESRVVLATARTFNAASPSGTYGQYIEALRLDDGGGLPTGSRMINGLAGNSNSRSNVGVVNLGDSPLSAALTVKNAAGAVIGNPLTVTVPARSVVQTNSVNQAAGAGGLDLFSVQVESSSPHASYVSRLDNRTSDPVFIPDDLEAIKFGWIDGVASAPGQNGTFFRTALSLTNESGSPITVDLSFVPRGSSASSAAKTVSISAGSSVFYSDCVDELFSLSNVAGQVVFTGGPVKAWARTYNDTPDGTFGQFIPAFGFTEPGANPIGGAYQGKIVLQGLSDDAAFRTNIGLLNWGSESANVTLELFGTNGSSLGVSSQTVGAGESAFLPRALLTITGSTSAPTSYAVISSSGKIYPWASVIDNKSGDAIFVRPIAP